MSLANWWLLPNSQRTPSKTLTEIKFKIGSSWSSWMFGKTSNEINWKPLYSGDRSEKEYFFDITLIHNKYDITTYQKALLHSGREGHSSALLHEIRQRVSLLVHYRPIIALSDRFWTPFSGVRVRKPPIVDRGPHQIYLHHLQQGRQDGRGYQSFFFVVDLATRSRN